MFDLPLRIVAGTDELLFFHQVLSTSPLRPDCRAILASVDGSTVHRKTVA